MYKNKYDLVGAILFSYEAADGSDVEIPISHLSFDERLRFGRFLVTKHPIVWVFFNHKSAEQF